MIKTVTFLNYLNESLVVTLADPDPDHGLLITSIDGLGPVKGNINTTELATSDGSIYNSARLGERNIVITFKFLFKDSIEDTRQRTYKYFPIKKPITMVFETDNRTLGITGYVEANEPNIFSKDEGAQLSIICPNPYFYDYGEDGLHITEFSAVESLFEFPFDNNSLSENLIEFGNIIEIREKSIVYVGDSNVGMIIRLHIIGAIKNITLYSLLNNETMTIDTEKITELTGSALANGDDIIISTIKGEKSVTLQREGTNINILNCLGKNSVWFQLYKGDNIIAYGAEEGVENIVISITNQVLYEGV